MPYWRLSGFYFFYFATVGALVPYWGLYLQSVGFVPREIGQLMALLMLSRIVAPYLWGWLADHSGERLRVVRLASLLAAVAFGGVFFGTTFWYLAGVMLTFSFFWNAALPVLEGATLAHLREHTSRYGFVRLWGSIGFIIAVAAVGPLLDARGTASLLPVVLALMLGIWLASLAIPDPHRVEHHPHPQRFLHSFLRLEVIAFLFACFLMQASHGSYYTFYSIYLHDMGYSKNVIGLLWAFAVVCEIGVFLAMRPLFARFSLLAILLASFLLAAVRWFAIAFFPDAIAVLLFAQMLHAATFGAFHASALQMIHGFFTGRHQHRGQAIYSSASFGLGGAVGSFYSGYVWSIGGGRLAFGIAALLALAAFGVAYWALRPKT